MERHGEEVEVSPREATSGAKLGIMRWVLGISLFLAIILLTAIWMTGTLFV